MAKISRREFFGNCWTGAKHIGLFAAINGVAAGAVAVFGVSEYFALEREKKLETKTYVLEIVNAASRVTNEKGYIGSAIAGFYVGDVGSSTALYNKSDRRKAIMGGVAFALGKTMDAWSTMKFSKTMHDPRFKKYGLDIMHKEINPFLGEHPSQTRIVGVNALTIAMCGYVGKTMPWLGFGYAGAAPFIVAHNLEGDRSIHHALNIGDRVDSMLERGATDVQVKSYLSSLSPEKPL